MGTDTDPETERAQSANSGSLSRRRVLRTAGFGAGVAALGGASFVAAGDDEETDQETDDGDDGENGDGEEDDGDDSALVDDLIDPVFGYPLGADETGQVDIDTVVEAATREGPGDHVGFPTEPGRQGETELPVEFLFDPVGVAVEPGDVVHFFVSTGLHTVTAFSEKYGEPEREVPTRVPEDSPGFTSPPLTAGESWLYQFPDSGVYDLLCLPHLPLGMVMRVVVFDPETDNVDCDLFTAPSSGRLPPNARAVLTDEALAPGTIIEAGTVGWADLDLGSDEPEPPGTETPGTEEPPTETPGTEEPPTETPGTEEPPTETPGTEEPPTETPGTLTPGTPDDDQ